MVCFTFQWQTSGQFLAILLSRTTMMTGRDHSTKELIQVPTSTHTGLLCRELKRYSLAAMSIWADNTHVEESVNNIRFHCTRMVDSLTPPLLRQVLASAK